MRADERVVAGEREPQVAGGAARAGVHALRFLCADLGQGGRVVVRGQGLEETLVGWGEAVVELVAAGPEGV